MTDEPKKNIPVEPGPEPEDDEIDESSEESFPASDPPAWNPAPGE